MKVILLIALFGISFCHGLGGGVLPGTSTESCSKPNPENANTGDCLIKLFEKSPAFVKTVYTFICEYRTNTREGNSANFKKAGGALVEVTKCGGCSLDHIAAEFGYKTFEELLKAVTEGAVDGGAVVEKLLGELKLSKEIIDAACQLLGPALSGDCLEQVLKSAGTLTKRLQELFCKREKLTDQEAADALVFLLENLACVLETLLGDSDKTAQEFVKDLGGHSKSLVILILGKLEELKVVNPLLCKATGGPGDIVPVPLPL